MRQTPKEKRKEEEKVFLTIAILDDDDDDGFYIFILRVGFVGGLCLVMLMSSYL